MEEKTKKPKKPKKKAEPKVLALPPNPTRNMSATVRKMSVDIATAIELVTKYEFRVVSREGDVCIMTADSVANRKYEAR